MVRMPMMVRVRIFTMIVVVVMAASNVGIFFIMFVGILWMTHTDKFWIQGKGDRVGIIQIVDKGVADKGMPSWNGLLTDKEIVSVVGYVYSLKGTNPANPKPAQGVEVQ